MTNKDWYAQTKILPLIYIQFKCMTSIMYIYHHLYCRILKKYSTYNIPSYGRSVQWTPFFTLSFPNKALKDFGRTCLASSGSWGPHNSLNDSTAFYCLTSRAIQGPEVNYAAIWVKSGTTPLYTSKNYSEVGLSSQNICKALI